MLGGTNELFEDVWMVSGVLREGGRHLNIAGVLWCLREIQYEGCGSAGVREYADMYRFILGWCLLCLECLREYLYALHSVGMFIYCGNIVM